MPHDRNAFKAGLFILVTIGLIVGVVIAVNGAARFEARQTRTATFKLSDDLGGLRVGDDVRVGGFKVGVVEAIDPVGLDGADPHLAVTFSLPTRYKLRVGAKVGVQTTLTGASAVNIDDLGAGAELSPGAVVAGRPDPKTALFASLGAAGPDVAAIARDVRTTTIPNVNAAVDNFRKTGEAGAAIAGRLNGKMDAIVGRYEVATDKAGTMLDSITAMVGPAAPDFRQTMANLAAVTGEVRQKLPGMLDKTQATLDGAAKAMEDVQKTAENAREATDTVRGLLGNNKGKIDGMLTAVKAAADNLKAATAEIRRSPWRLLYKPQEGELGNLALYDSARQFAEGATQLNDAAAALRDALNTGKSDPQELQQLVNRLEKTFANFREVEEKLWQGVRQ